MAVDWKIVLCFILWMCAFSESALVENLGLPPAPEFARVTTIRPKLIHYRHKRHISTTRADKDGVEHIHDVTVALDMNGRNQLLDLRLNRELIPKGYFEKHQKNGSYEIRRPNHKEVELCHYQGKLRGAPNSWAAVSTCHGLRGVVYDGKELHYLERATDRPDIHDVDHYLYSHSNLVSNSTCGYQGTDHSHIDGFHEINRISKRFKRSEEVIRGPYNANARSSYVELVLVMDNKEYKALGENMDKVNSHCKDIANIINALYVPLNIFIALVGVVVWTEYDEIALSANGDTTLTNFLHYRREKLVKEHPNDNAQLLTRIQFEGGVVGKALKGPICTFEFSGGVSMDHSAVVGLVATTVAHEMGHNFGMEHDSSDCQCPDDRCIMAPSSSSMSPTHWSSCSLEYLALAFEHGMDYCLRNKPTKLFDSPVCGNGFVEAGEQCDCGLKDHCDNPCCNPNTCMLFSNASCATGECCDLKTCRPKTVGTLCREADQECDLAEYCTGHSEFCPEDVFKMDGIKCNRGKAYCYKGSCRTHSDQCKLLWGPSGKSSDTQCYKMNKKGSRHGNCGYNRLNQSYIKCQDPDTQCGMLHCTHLNERLEFGMESVAILSHSFINSAGSIIPCRTAIVDLGLNEVDPGLAPDGARCGDGKMCVNQKCMSVENMWASGSVTQCPNNCNNNGVCNSRGHCHCNMGFAPPNCDYPGPGGSQDSGPASDPNARREFVIFLYVTFLGIVPFIAVVSLFVYYMKRNPTFWRKKPRIAMYVPWLFPSPSHTRNVDVFVVNPPAKYPEPVYCTVDGETPINTLKKVHQLGTQSLNTHFDNQAYISAPETTAQLNVKDLSRHFETRKKIGRPPPPPPPPINCNLPVNNAAVSWTIATPPVSPSGHSFDSNDTDDSWDSDPYPNSLYNTIDNRDKTSQHNSKKSVIENSMKAVYSAKSCVNKGFKNMTLLMKSNNFEDSKEQKYRRAKIDIVKKDFVSTTNIQVQNMMSSSNSLSESKFKEPQS